MKITHDKLVKCAKRWLTNAKGCRVVATELRSAVFEEPDAIGWGPYARSVLVECKVSRADFRSDLKKSRAGVGVERWYLVTPGLLKPEEVPEGWGLAEYRPSNHRSGHYVKILKNAGALPHSILKKEEADLKTIHRLQNEMTMLVSVAARSLEALALVGNLGVGEKNE